MEHKKLIEEIERREWYNKMAPFPVYDTEIIDDIKKLKNVIMKEHPNNEPITYCKTCLSIHVKTVKLHNGDVDYCVPCGNTDLETAHILEWEDLYEERYGERFITESKKKRDGRK